ncbi:uncharacterized mitochondrial protein AtMg00820-like [Lycium ferocissimum]|uniref:uncharacterized mitochondrial protein AtMg00820-like n=1 Tax=Lycium ferocissimum TaxID=112874 RepID=UPI0028151F34|nr:uncharacterized mitochondrial protein AtMg00820-like [Lycium ferocissimum]
MEEELSALEDNHTWNLISKPAEASIIGSKWIYSVKKKSDGTLERYKARLVAQGYKQQYGLDYDETLFPLAKMMTIRLLLTITSVKQRATSSNGCEKCIFAW